MEQAAESGSKVGEALAKGTAPAEASSQDLVSSVMQGISTMGKGFDWLKGRWTKFSAMITGMFSAIGVIKQVISITMTLYNFLTQAEREREEAAKKAEEAELKRIEESAKAWRQYIQERSHQKALEAEAKAADAILQKYKEGTDEIRTQARLIQKKIDLEQGFSDDQAEKDRLKVEEDYSKGKLTGWQ